jgi:hypothetical protein
MGRIDRWTTKMMRKGLSNINTQNLKVITNELHNYVIAMENNVEFLENLQHAYAKPDIELISGQKVNVISSVEKIKVKIEEIKDKINSIEHGELTN